MFKVIMVKLNECIFLLRVIKNIIVFRKKHFYLKRFDNEPVYNKKFLKTETKSYRDESTECHD